MLPMRAMSWRRRLAIGCGLLSAVVVSCAFAALAWLNASTREVSVPGGPEAAAHRRRQRPAHPRVDDALTSFGQV